ncbi:hypothetical protein SAMN05444682_1162 [Parapedobacter indicus]|uniref:Uncharacterized protein n=1 Tax=Parapedobacter indicus TaxID=1477437 RepID=A0A1I3V7T3_9SPHI|nr:hypothetical protein CLV26_11682 [Parapedobacter indicus]SFJ91468.1 hypothetical protein SAMN05444682_1162 [Parapedobacter indicus]
MLAILVEIGNFESDSVNCSSIKKSWQLFWNNN